MINNEKNLKRRRRRTNKTMGKLKLSNETKTSLIALALIAITALANIGPGVLAALAYFGVISASWTALLEIAGFFVTTGSIGWYGANTLHSLNLYTLAAVVAIAAVACWGLGVAFG
jgi:hypothetical protein